MNFLDESEITQSEVTEKTKQPSTYQMSNSGNVIDVLASEANAQSARVNDEMFLKTEIPDDDFESSEPETKSPEQRRTMERTSYFVVRTADDVITRLIANYAHCTEDQTDKLKGSPAQLKEIAKHLEPYFGTDNLNLPPWIMALISAGVMLFDKFTIASEMRKVNLQLIEEKAKREKLERENRDLKLEIENQRLQNENDKLKTELTPQ